MRCFLSHNKADKDVARSIAAHLSLAGIDVWFDEWEVQAGDSIPGMLNAGLLGFDCFILIWSSNAKRSDWVRQELHAAIMRATVERSAKIVPCVLDQTPLPPLIQDRRYVDLTNVRSGVEELIEGLTGSLCRRARLLAIQKALSEMEVDWTLHPTLPPLLCCPNCGEETSLRPWTWVDHDRDDAYAGVRCIRCGWSDGGST